MSGDEALASGDASDFPTSDAEDEHDRRQRAERDDLSTHFGPLSEQEWFEGEPPGLTPLVHYKTDGEHEYGGKAWLPRGKPGMLVAPGGTGKTQALIQLAMCVASPNSSRKWLGLFEVPDQSQGPVVLALGEESERDLHRRIANVFTGWKNGAKTDPASDDEKQAIARNLYALPMAEKSTALMEEPTPMWALDDAADRELERELAERGEAPSDVPLEEREKIKANIRSRLRDGWSEQYEQWRELLRHPPTANENQEPIPWKAIILDPASQFIGPEVEKDNASATRFVRMLGRWAAKPWHLENDVGPTVLCAHHASQNAAGQDTDDFLDNPHAARGSTALTGGFRWQANMCADETDGAKYVRMRIVKENDGVEGDTVGMKMDDETGVLEWMECEKIERRLSSESSGERTNETDHIEARL